MSAETKPTYTEKCPKCHGSGLWLSPTSLGHNKCTQCNGAGYHTFKSSKEAREKAKQQRADREIAKADERLALFEAEHPLIAAWWKDSTFPFAVSLRSAVRKYGDLTEKQLQAARSTASKFMIASEASKAVERTAQKVDTSQIEAVFGTALKNGLKRPMLRIGDFRFSPAGTNSKNPGAIYVKEHGAYLGKIVEGKFLRSWSACSAEKAEEVQKVAADPKGSAVAHGKLTGCCAICGRGLTDEKSVAAGIGPICAEKFGWN